MQEILQGKSSPYSKPKGKAESIQEAVRPRYKARREEKKQEKLKVLKRAGISVSDVQQHIVD